MTNKEHHAAICQELTSLYERKNHDYGDSFRRSWEKYGLLMLIIRLDDKLSRLATLAQGSAPQVKDESIRDTLADIANYCIMGVMELDQDAKSREGA